MIQFHYVYQQGTIPFSFPGLLFERPRTPIIHSHQFLGPFIGRLDMIHNGMSKTADLSKVLLHDELDEGLDVELVLLGSESNLQVLLKKSLKILAVLPNCMGENLIYGL